MKIEIREHDVLVTREKGDPAYYGIQNAAGESKLFYAIKNKLISQGHDLIKKRMAKDGHMVSDMQQYIRTRKTTGNPENDIAIYNTFWQIEGAEKRFNEGSVSLGLIRGIFEKDESEAI